MLENKKYSKKHSKNKKFFLNLILRYIWKTRIQFHLYKLHTYTGLHTHTHTHTHIYIYMFFNSYLYMHIYIKANIHIHTYKEKCYKPIKYIYIYIYSWLTAVKVNPKTPFSIATTTVCSTYPWFVPYNAEC